MLGPELLASILPGQAQHLLPDTLSLFDRVQIISLTPEAFGGLSIPAIQAIQPDIVSYITVDQLKFLSGKLILCWCTDCVVVALESMSCEQVLQFTEVQMDSFNEEQYEAYNREVNSCVTTTSTTGLHPIPTGYEDFHLV